MWDGHLDYVQRLNLFTKFGADLSRYSAVWKHSPIDNLWIMRSSRGLVLRGRSAFFVELIKFVLLSSLKILDMTLLERPRTLPMAKQTVHHSSSEQLGVEGFQLPWSGSECCESV